jgi:hypothetical protein
MKLLSVKINDTFHGASPRPSGYGRRVQTLPSSPVPGVGSNLVGEMDSFM